VIYAEGHIRLCTSNASSIQSIVLSVCISWQSAFVNSQFEDWSVNSPVAWQVKSGGGMTFVAVEAAGHMVHGALGPATSGEGGSIIFMHDIVLNRYFNMSMHLKSITSHLPSQ